VILEGEAVRVRELRVHLICRPDRAWFALRHFWHHLPNVRVTVIYAVQYLLGSDLGTRQLCAEEGTSNRSSTRSQSGGDFLNCFSMYNVVAMKCAAVSTNWRARITADTGSLSLKGNLLSHAQGPLGEETPRCDSSAPNRHALALSRVVAQLRLRRHVVS
jgi:hypothetical protein